MKKGLKAVTFIALRLMSSLSAAVEQAEIRTPQTIEGFLGKDVCVKKCLCFGAIFVSLLLIGCSSESDITLSSSVEPNSFTNSAYATNPAPMFYETLDEAERINANSDFGSVFLLSQVNTDDISPDELVSPSEGLFIASYYYPKTETEICRITSIVFETSDYNLFGFSIGYPPSQAEEVLIDEGYMEPEKDDIMYNFDDISDIKIYRKYDITVTLYCTDSEITGIAIVVLDPSLILDADVDIK